MDTLWSVLKYGNGIATGVILTFICIAALFVLFKQTSFYMLQKHLEETIERFILAKQGLTSLKHYSVELNGFQATQWQYNGYLVWEIPGALGEAECDALVAGEGKAADAAIKPLLNLLSRFSGVPASHNEQPEFIHLKDGDKEHVAEFDWCKEGAPGCESGPREATLLVWLNDAAGSHIEFPAIDLEVKAEKGKALFFFATDDRGHPFMESLWKMGQANPGGESWLAMTCTRRRPVVQATATAAAATPASTTSIEEARPVEEPDTQVPNDTAPPEDLS